MITLLIKLQDKTKKGIANWEETTKKESYQLSLPKYSLNISLGFSRKNPESIEYFLKIYDDTGRLIEQVGDEDFHVEGFEAYSVMKDIHETARRIAMGTEKAIDNILSELAEVDDDIPF